jgi:hypothetical protein
LIDFEHRVCCLEPSFIVVQDLVALFAVLVILKEDLEVFNSLEANLLNYSGFSIGSLIREVAFADASEDGVNGIVCLPQGFYFIS